MSGTDEEIVVALTANAEQLQEGMAQGAASIESLQETVAQEAAAFNAAVQAKIESMARLNAAFSSNVTSNEGMAEAESALDQAMNVGAITASEYAAYVARLDAAEAAAAVSASAATAAVTEQTAALSISGGVARELGVMIGELARGNYTRLEGSTITLANRTGFLSTALNAVLSPLGLVAIAAAALGYSIFEAGQQFEAMEGTVLATGDASGYTAGQLVGMADKIGASTGSISNASEAVQKLAESGRFAGQDLRLVATAAADMSALTGESIQSCVAQIEKLQEDPLKAVAKLNDQFHFLTVAEFEQMQQLVKAGDTMGAATVAYEAMANTMQGRTDTLNTHVNVLVSTFRKLKTAWAEDMQAMDVSLGGGDTAEQLQVAQRTLRSYQEQNAALLQMGGSNAGVTAELRAQTAVVESLTAKFKQETQSAVAVGAAAQKSAQQIDQMAKAAKGHADDTQATQQDKERFEQMELDRNLSLQQEKAYWEQIKSVAKDGSAEYRQALEQLVEIHRKEGESAKEAARKEVEARKQASAAALNDLAVQREQTQAASAERIQVDATTMDRVVQMYGQNSEQYKRALAERLADTKAYVASVVEEEKKAEAANEATYKSETDLAIRSVNEVYAAREKAAQSQLQLGQVTGTQEVEMLRQYAQQEYDIELGILNHYKDLMANKPNIVQTINGQIEQLEQKHAAAMQQIDEKAAQQQLQTWTKYLNPISQAFNQSITGMIQGTQTFHQAWDRMLQSMLMSELRTGTRTLMHWIATEASKTAATEAAAAARTSAQASATAEGMATEAAAQQKEIANAASTAAAKAYQSLVGIPIVGPVLAPIAAGVAYGAVEAFGGDISSAAGGWERVPYDDAPALLHRNEMVLPAHLAENVRNMTGNGGGKGGGDTHHWNINATDAKSVTQLLKNDPRGLAKAAQRALRYTKGR